MKLLFITICLLPALVYSVHAPINCTKNIYAKICTIEQPMGEKTVMAKYKNGKKIMCYLDNCTLKDKYGHIKHFAFLDGNNVAISGIDGVKYDSVDNVENSVIMMHQLAHNDKTAELELDELTDPNCLHNEFGEYCIMVEPSGYINVVATLVNGEVVLCLDTEYCTHIKAEGNGLKYLFMGGGPVAVVGIDGVTIVMDEQIEESVKVAHDLLLKAYAKEDNLDFLLKTVVDSDCHLKKSGKFCTVELSTGNISLMVKLFAGKKVLCLDNGYCSEKDIKGNKYKYYFLKNGLVVVVGFNGVTIVTDDEIQDDVKEAHKLLVDIIIEKNSAGLKHH